MLYVVSHKDIDGCRDLMQQAFLLRHQVFVEEKGWEYLRRPDGREIDQFDCGDAVHMFVVDEAGDLLGYQRMLSSTKPHLLSDVMPQLSRGERPVGAYIWEWTRFCVAKQHRAGGDTLGPVANVLLSGIVEWGMQTGVTRIIIEMDIKWLGALAQLHFFS